LHQDQGQLVNSGSTEHTIVLRPFFRNYLGKMMPEEIRLNFMVQGKITLADTPTIRLGTTPSGLIIDLPPSFPHFMPDALPATTLPIFFYFI